MQSHGITLSFHREMADSSGELGGPDIIAAVRFESYPRFIIQAVAPSLGLETAVTPWGALEANFLPW
jgi:hypothetical protein